MFEKMYFHDCHLKRASCSNFFINLSFTKSSAFRIEFPMVKNQHCNHPRASTNALDTDSLALQLRGLSDGWFDHKGAVKFVDQAGDENHIQPSRNRTEGRP